MSTENDPVAPMRALVEYMQHLPGCVLKAVRHQWMTGPPPCTCGLDALLSAAPAGSPLSENEGELLRWFSDRLTGGNAGTWDEIKHALESASPGSPWRAIASAPKDGTTMLLYAPRLGGNFLGEWHEGNGWYLGSYGFACEAIEQPTHWMPLPDPPSGSPQETSEQP